MPTSFTPSARRGPDRRTVVLGLGAAALAAAAPDAPDARAAAAGAPAAAVLPFDVAGAADGSGRLAVAHWHWFPRSFDNADPASDYYRRELMRPEGQGGRYRDGGGFVLERPLPRAPIAAADWETRDMLEDVREAAAIGLDGFQFNIAWVSDDFGPWRLFHALQDAIARSGLPFGIMVNFDCTTPADDHVLETFVGGIADAHARGGLMAAPDGRMLLSAFMAEAWPAEFWRRVFDGFAARGIGVRFLPMFLDLSAASDAHLALADVVSAWTGNHLPGVRQFADYARGVAAAGKPWMAPIFPQDCRPKDLWYAEAAGSAVFRAGWAAAIEGGAEIAAVLTWNDYSESSEIRPSTGIQYGYYDLAAYHVAWFKTGAPPPIRRDGLLYFHRVQEAGAAAGGEGAPPRMRMRYGPGPANAIELVGFLTAPGRLEIETTEGVAGQDVGAGLQVVRAPLAEGRPRFRLVRDGAVVVAVESAFTVVPATGYDDLLYRSGGSFRPAIATPEEARR